MQKQRFKPKISAVSFINLSSNQTVILVRPVKRKFILITDQDLPRSALGNAAWGSCFKGATVKFV